eukprot:1176382-Prorocentrum_minimum.AAC.5
MCLTKNGVTRGNDGLFVVAWAEIDAPAVVMFGPDDPHASESGGRGAHQEPALPVEVHLLEDVQLLRLALSKAGRLLPLRVPDDAQDAGEQHVQAQVPEDERHDVDEEPHKRPLVPGSLCASEAEEHVSAQRRRIIHRH